jgi:FixJ family two-component response regulator
MDASLQGETSKCSGRQMTKSLPESPSLVFVVDDDVKIREALESLFRSVDLRVQTFGSTREFLKTALPNVPSCLVLDVRMPGQSGLDFQTELANNGIHIPIIFMTGHGDVPMTVRAMKAGAIEFLQKPLRDQDMLDAVRIGIERDRKRRTEADELAKLKSCFDNLTPREREIMGLVTSGLLNKQVAARIGLSEITVKVHRGNTMRKMGAKTLADLVRMAHQLDLRRDGKA